MMYFKGVSMDWWAEANTAVFLINRSTGRVHSGTTPYEMGVRVKPCMEHLRVLGSMSYAQVDKTKRTKLDSNGSSVCIWGMRETPKDTGYRT